MRTSTRSTLLAAALAALALGASGCKKSSGSTPPACSPNDAACTSGGECCSESCNIPTGQTAGTCGAPPSQCKALGEICASPGDCCDGNACNGRCVLNDTCKAKGLACSAPQECCTNACEGGICTDPPTICRELTVACTANGDCCSGYCDAGFCDNPPAPTCRDLGVACNLDSQCCSAVCDGTGHCARDGGMCTYPGESCGSDAQCCSRICTGGTCSSNTCIPSGTGAANACASDAQCCSGICGFGSRCEPIPAGSSGSTCGTLGEACASAADCCSTNCQSGTCVAVAACSSPGDLCYRGEDCCSGLCDASGAPGRCLDAPGGCGQDGYPCAADSNCCTRKCLDLGTGAKACQPSGGCRMNGDYCDGDASCCNVNFPPTQPSQYVHCDPTDHVCDNGGSCNPPGDICGYKASQNCCYGKSDVCKPDVAGIMRCFGGCMTNDCTQGPCPSGWDGNDPNCCIQPGEVCQFRDQCCGLAPCVPGADGILRCGEPPTQCLPSGAICSTAPAPAPGYTPVQGECCDGALCRYVPEFGWACATTAPPPVCLLPDATCSTAGGATPCCVGRCLDTDPTAAVDLRCASCLPNGNACTSGSQCCSTICDGGFCRPPCQQTGGACTISADCCSGLSCDIPPGATSGTCQGGTGPTCSSTGQSCLTLPCCDSADTCTAGTCTAPVQCSEPAQPCTVGGAECCQGLQCYTLNAFEERVACTAGSSCFCDAPACAPLAQPCSTLVPCCGGYCGQNVGGANCTTADTSQCSCKTAP